MPPVTTASEPNPLMNDDPPSAALMDSEPAYTTGLGAAYQGDSKNLLEELEDNTIDLVVTSPPFALQHQKEYGNEDLDEYNDWFMGFAEEVQRVLQPHGSFVIEIGGAFKRGTPERSTYQFELLKRLTDDGEGQLKLAQDLYWFNPAKLPNPIEWVNVRKMRVTDAVTQIWWLAKEINKDPAYTDELRQKVSLIQSIIEELGEAIDREDLLKIVESVLRGDEDDDDEDGVYTQTVREQIETHLPDYADDISALIEASEKAPKVYVNQVLEAVTAGEPIPEPEPRPEANNQRVLQEYSESQKDLLEEGEYNDGKRPSGWDIDAESFANENAGAIPKNLIEASNTASNTHYQRMCRKTGHDPHPARFPPELPEFFVDFLTPNPPYDDWNRGLLDRPVVLDIFAGSNITGKVAEERGRYWLAFEQEPRYLKSSQLRFLTEKEIDKQLDEDQTGLGDFEAIDGDD